MRCTLLALALALAGGCLFIDDQEHAARLAEGDTGDSGDSGDGGDSGDSGGAHTTERYSGTMTLTLQLRDGDAPCAGSATFELASASSVEDGALTGEGSCLIEAADLQDVDGLEVLVTLSGALDTLGSGAGAAELVAEGNTEPGTWTATLDPSTGLLVGELTGEVKLHGEGKVEVEGAWEATRQDAP